MKSKFTTARIWTLAALLTLNAAAQAVAQEAK